MELAAISSLPSLSAVNCCAEGTTCASESRPTWLALPRRRGFATVAHGLDTQVRLDMYRNFWTSSFRKFWRIQDLIRSWRELLEFSDQCWAEMNTTLTSLADGADLLVAGMGFEQSAANVAEYYDIPLATLHYIPIRAKGQLVTILPSPLARSAMTVYEWLYWGACGRSRRTRSAVNWAYRRQQISRRDGSPNADRWKSRPTTRFASSVANTADLLENFARLSRVG